MMWESGIVNWYYNYTGIPWQKYGSFTPDFREGRYFDIGVVLGGRGNPPYQDAFFYQFGVSSKVPVSGWTVRLLYPSFMYQGVWRLMEKARTIQGDHSYWKANYRWGGYPYLGVWAKGNALDSSIHNILVDRGVQCIAFGPYAEVWIASPLIIRIGSGNVDGSAIHHLCNGPKGS